MADPLPGPGIDCAVLRTSITDCINDADGSIDVDKFLLHTEEVISRQRWATSTVTDLLDVCGSDLQSLPPPNSPPAQPREIRKRAPRRVWARKSTDDGPLEPISPQESSWYVMYVSNILIADDSRMMDKFRVRFRLPYPNYIELVETVRSHTIFDRWCGHKKNGKKSTPVELLVLGALRYLGRGWTFDDIEESTAVSNEVHRVFLHCFIEFGSTVLFEKHIVFPVRVDEARSNMQEYAAAGFPGCVGSADCTHIITERCEFYLKNNHLGPKSSHTTRTFNLTCNHRRRILHTTNGGPGRWNDQTMVRLDNFIMGIRESTILGENTFELLSRDGDGTVRNVTYSGVYLLVDNGYLDWSCTVPPMTMTNKISEIRWSKWVESMRKDVECTFGILKGRFRILKAGIHLLGVMKVDDVWKTCCALHNWLLDIDGISAVWQNGVRVWASDWSGPLGELEFEGVREEVPNAIARLSMNLDPRNYDLSGMGPGEDVTGDETVPYERSHQIMRSSVSNLTLTEFRSRLIEHFDLAFHRNDIVWPSTY